VWFNIMIYRPLWMANVWTRIEGKKYRHRYSNVQYSPADCVLTMHLPTFRMIQQRFPWTCATVMTTFQTNSKSQCKYPGITNIPTHFHMISLDYKRLFCFHIGCRFDHIWRRVGRRHRCVYSKSLKAKHRSIVTSHFIMVYINLLERQCTTKIC
jgi:hypothetical protein